MQFDTHNENIILNSNYFEIMFLIENVISNRLWLEISNLTVMDRENICTPQNSYDN